MSRQLTHHTTNFERRKFPLVLLCDGVASPANIGSLFRLADAFSIEKLVLCGKPVDLSSPRIQKTARGTVQRMEFEQREDIKEVCLEFREKGYALLALEITNDSLALDSFSFNSFDKIALVLGNEIAGIDQEILQIASNVLHITMFGTNSSMNVAQSAGIALYEITKSLQPYQ